MKVLHVQKVAGIGGSERHLLALLPALAGAGVDVRMLVAATGDADRFLGALGESGVPVRSVPAGPDLNPVFAGAIARELRRFRPDVLHTHLIHADVHGQLALAAGDAVRVSSVHSTPAFLRRTPLRVGARIAARGASAVIAISEHVRRFLEELRLVAPERIHVVHYGIDVAGWRLDERDRGATRERLGLAPGDLAVGIAARLIPGKGHDVLLDAVAKARVERPEIRLLAAGAGPLRAELERQAERLDAGPRPFLGFVGDIRDFMNACDVIAFPTQPALGEGFGLAALEAMACGRPVVATAVASLPEVVRDGETGCLVPPGSADGLAATLVALAADPALRRRLGASGAERARTDFSLDRMVDRTLDVYRSAPRPRLRPLARRSSSGAARRS